MVNLLVLSARFPRRGVSALLRWVVRWLWLYGKCLQSWSVVMLGNESPSPGASTCDRHELCYECVVNKALEDFEAEFFGGLNYYLHG